MTFQEAQQRYAQLAGQWRAGQLDPQAFAGAVAELRVQDASGRWWTLEATTGGWLVWDGSSWVAGRPPVASPAPPRPQGRPPDATMVSMPVEATARPTIPPRPPERPPEAPGARPSPPPRPPEVALCASCQAPLPPGARFCAVCGTPVGTAPQPASPAVCAACGKPLEPGTRFCRWCGSKVVS